MGEGQEKTDRERVNVREIENFLNRLTGVESVRLVVNDWGAIEEVHVLSGPERNPKQVVRDIESCMAAKWGLSVDHKKISVAQLKDDLVAGTSFDPYVDHLSITNTLLSGKTRVEVTLRDRGNPDVEYSGFAEGPNSKGKLPWLAAEAALRALDPVVAEFGQLGVEKAFKEPVAGGQVAVVVLGLVSRRGDNRLVVGGVQILDDTVRAFIDATIDTVKKLPGMSRGSLEGLARHASKP